MKIGRDEKRIDCIMYTVVLVITVAASGMVILTLCMMKDAEMLGKNAHANLYAVIMGILLSGLACLGILVSAVRIRGRKRVALLMQEVVNANASADANSKFLSMISHEIRTPMNLMMGISELSRKSVGNIHKMTECMDNFENAAKYLLSLTNNILDFASIDKGKLKLVNEVFCISDFIRDIEALYRPMAKKKNQTFNVNVSVKHDLVVSDPNRIQQVIFNLVTNAVKYTPRGGVIELRVTESDGGFYKFAVRDNGIGINDKDIEKIFMPFERIMQSGECCREQGNGLGLSISRGLLKMLGSELKVKSRAGEGSEFSFRLKLERGVGMPAGKTVRKINGIKGCKILLADDSELSLGIIGDLFRAEGLIVETAKSGREAVDKFLNSKAGEFDGILMDVQMPEMDGLTAARLIRSSGRYDACTVPMIAMTGFCTETDHLRSLNAGFSCHVDKPVDVRYVCDLLDELINKKDEKDKKVC